MAELIEYSLALLLSSLMVGGSVEVYTMFAGFESHLQFRALFGDLLSLASQALRNGSSTATLPLPDSHVGCSGGTLSLASGGENESAPVGASCQFSFDISGGTHRVGFTWGGEQLRMKVA